MGPRPHQPPDELGDKGIAYVNGSVHGQNVATSPRAALVIATKNRLSWDLTTRQKEVIVRNAQIGQDQIERMQACTNAQEVMAILSEEGFELSALMSCRLRKLLRPA